VAEALLRAQQRGLEVRVVVDGENMEAPEVAKIVGELETASIPVFIDRREAFMHNKFAVLDEQVVWTGSANLTVNDVYRNNNNMLRIVEPNLAVNYTAKMNDLMAGEGGTKGDSVLVNPQIAINGVPVITMFSPDDPVTDDVVARIQAAEQRVDVMAFAFTSDPIAQALIEARTRGLAVRAVMEGRNSKGTGSEFATLQGGGVDIHSDGNCYIMHSKTIIIDGRTVITGSFNWTRAAQQQNDENVLIIEDPSLAARYLEEFERVYNQALQPTRCGG
jgi:phosphatidylserine/phosphatidylglycerophosphate/cardiolipin synthase-like enzyme